MSIWGQEAESQDKIQIWSRSAAVIHNFFSKDPSYVIVIKLFRPPFEFLTP
jgi:hypothetical protein